MAGQEGKAADLKKGGGKRGPDMRAVEVVISQGIMAGRRGLASVT